MDLNLDLNLNQGGELGDFIFQNNDVISSVSNTFDFEKLLAMGESEYSSNESQSSPNDNQCYFVVEPFQNCQDQLFNESDIQFLLDNQDFSENSSSDSSPSNSSPNSSNNLNSPPSPTSPLTFKVDNKLDTMTVTSEIILNFEQIDEFKFLEQFDLINADDNNEMDDDDSLLSDNKNDACIELENEDEDVDIGYTLDKKGNMVPLVLSSEEKTVFKKEGFQLPSHMPLTKSEEKLLKLVRRKIRNKKSAHVSRERKKKYVDGLEKRVDLCTRENENLYKQIKALKNQNAQLMTKMKNMQTLISSVLIKHKKSSTAVLFVSFFVTFCVYPFMDVPEDPNAISSLQTIPYAGFSRTLLSSDLNLSKTLIKKDNSQDDNYDNMWDYYKNRFDF